MINGVRFIGATLWTDYAVAGDRDRGPAMAQAAREMNDHRAIMWRAGSRELFMPAHALELHINSATAIEELLAQPYAGPTIVMTHHAPSPRSIARRCQGNGLNPAFCSDLNEMIFRHRPMALVHGHMHVSSDYRLGRTRVISNPHGYRNENACGFDPALILDTEAA